MKNVLPNSSVAILGVRMSPASYDPASGRGRRKAHKSTMHESCRGRNELILRKVDFHAFVDTQIFITETQILFMLSVNIVGERDYLHTMNKFPRCFLTQQQSNES